MLPEIRVPSDIHGAVSGFLVDLAKGLLDDKRWNWDVDNLSGDEWQVYQESFLNPTHLRTTLAVFMNNLRLSTDNQVLNYDDARFRACQYFRAYLSIGGFSWDQISPAIEPWELEEPD